MLQDIHFIADSAYRPLLEYSRWIVSSITKYPDAGAFPDKTMNL
jgi:hypothetical protein